MKKIFFITAFLFTFAAFSILFSQTSKSSLTNIAVLNFDALGISKVEATALSERFRGELVKTKSFIVIERDKMDDVLEEQAFQMTGCTSAECAVEAGKLLNVQKMITGTIGKIGTTYTIDISMVNVENGRIEQSLNRNYKGAIDGLLLILKEIALEMVPQIQGISKWPLYVSGATAILTAGLATYSYFQAENYYDKYQLATTVNEAKKYKNDTKNFDTMVTVFGITAISSGGFYFIYKMFYTESKTPWLFGSTSYSPENDTFILTLRASF